MQWQAEVAIGFKRKVCGRACACPHEKQKKENKKKMMLMRHRQPPKDHEECRIKDVTGLHLYAGLKLKFFCRGHADEGPPAVSGQKCAISGTVR